ncbi:hypothetical protein AX15_003721 [Amanita polypyramis BW_CC]|nr:hypothetical protein AX15_003721 [Amanita polypyramis BW_CC]
MLSNSAAEDDCTTESLDDSDMVTTRPRRNILSSPYADHPTRHPWNKRLRFTSLVPQNIKAMVSLCMLNHLSPLRAIVNFYVRGKRALSTPDAMAQKIYAEGMLNPAGKQAKAKEDAAMIACRRRVMLQTFLNRLPRHTIL